ncbi:WD40 domain-containing protein [Fulvivirga lutea]|uniref:Caspase family protein n=1 Tax=Fulvivirga lutea TaxID=2810512 RepID=A0A975A291_9BACT|nr:caspase family protein [Fulvivirga lutea]QSE98292.1 caspase family protein [Fulvivirga lutea]
MKITSFLIFFLTSTITFSQKLETVIQRGHISVIKTVATTPDGRYLLTGSRDKTIILWELKTGRKLRTFFGHTNTINDLAVSKDGSFFISSGADGRAIQWSIIDGKILNTFSISEEYLTSVALSYDDKYLVTAGFESKAYLWNLNSGDTIKSFQVNPDKGVGYGVEATVSSDNQIYFGNDNRTVTSYNFKGDKLFEYKPETGWCGGCATFLDINNDALVSLSNNSSLIIHNPKTGDIISEFKTDIDDSRGVKISKNSTYLLQLTDDSLFVFDVKSKQKLYSLYTDDKVNEAIFSVDESEIVTVDDEQKITIYESRTGKLLRTLGGINVKEGQGLDYNPNSRWDYYIKKYTDLKNDFDISPDNKYLAKAKVGSAVRIWEIQSGQIISELRGHEKAVLSVKYSNNGKYIATGGADGQVKIWTAETGDLLATLKGHREVVFDLSFSNDDAKLISGSWDGTAIVWNLADYTPEEVYRFNEGSPFELSFYRDDIYALMARLDKTLSLYELDSKSTVTNFIGHTDIIHSIDHHENTLVSVSWDGTIKAWDILTGLQIWRKKDLLPQYALAIEPINGTIAASGENRDIELLKLSDGSSINTLRGHQAPVTDIKFTNTGKWLVSSSEDGMIKIWDLENNEELVSYVTFDNNEWVAINKAGYFSGSLNAFNKIAFVKGMESYSVDQFFNKYYQPDLLNKTFSKSTSKLDINEQIRKSPPPTVEFIAPHPNEVVKTDKIDVIIKVEDQGGGAEKIVVMHNKKIIHEAELELKNGRSAVTVQVPLITGANTLEAVAINSVGIESHRQSTTVEKEGKKSSSLYVFAIGINHYENEDLNLNYARADAEGFIDVIKTNTKNLFEKVEVIPLFDKEATKANIFEQLKLLEKRITPQDVLFFYYAGHGSMVDGNFYIVPTDNVKLYSEDKLKQNGISATELQNELQNISALKQLLIIDACQSGGSVELLAQRGAPEEKALAQLSRSTGIHVLAAAGSEQFATEFKELGHGIFTYVLLEALSGKADGSPNDGKVTIYELKSYLDDQVPEFSKKHKGKMQFPHTFSKGQDFPIIIK